jgi:hypothetical protein
LEDVKTLCQFIYDRKGGVGKYVIDLECLNLHEEIAAHI